MKHNTNRKQNKRALILLNGQTLQYEADGYFFCLGGAEYFRAQVMVARKNLTEI